jgi:hypothetical protein
MITLNYEIYATGQKEWADSLNRQTNTHESSELSEAENAVLARIIELSARHPLTFETTPA